MNEKVKVGQVLKSKGGVRYKITKIADKDGVLFAWSRGVLYNGSLDKEEAPFGSLTKDGLPNTWGANWEVEVEPPKTQTPGAASLEENRSKMMRFFRTSSHPENCDKCGAPKPCSYHP